MDIVLKSKETTIERIERFLVKEIPFVVVQYFEYLKGREKETVKKYELMYLNAKNEIAYKLLTDEEVSFFKTKINEMELKIENSNGKIYEFNDFKENYENLKQE